MGRLLEAEEGLGAHEKKGLMKTNRVSNVNDSAVKHVGDGAEGYHGCKLTNPSTQTRKLKTDEEPDWQNDPYTLNSHFGTADDLHSLSTALHARNMSLMVDIVINHFGAATDSKSHQASSISYDQFPAPFNTSSAFHKPCTVDFSSQTSIENCWISTSGVPLADIDSENSTVFDALVDAYKTLVQTYNIDGVRLDSAKNTPKKYLAQFQDALGECAVLGEVTNSAASYVAEYQGPLNSTLNYPLWYAIVASFAKGKSFNVLGGTQTLESSAFSDRTTLGNFLDNHDQPRFASYSRDDVAIDQNAVTYLMFATGIPIVYYGFEQRFTGGGDPQNREALWKSKYDTTTTLYQHISLLHQIRGNFSSGGDNDGFFTNEAKDLVTEDHGIAFQRGPLTVVLTNVGGSGKKKSKRASSTDGKKDVTVTGLNVTAGTGIVDLVSCETATVNSTGTFTSLVNNGMPRVSLFSSLLSRCYFSSFLPRRFSSTAPPESSSSTLYPLYSPLHPRAADCTK